jgi:hypothetical protein
MPVLRAIPNQFLGVLNIFASALPGFGFIVLKEASDEAINQFH